MQQMELCGKCAELMKEKNVVRVVSRPINHKVVCESCKWRRFGGTYAVEPRKEKK